MNQGLFTTLFGNNPRNNILEYFLEARELDHAASDIIQELKMNKATTYATIHALQEEELITPTRTIGKTTLYTLAHNNKTALLKQTFTSIIEQELNPEKRRATSNNIEEAKTQLNQ